MLTKHKCHWCGQRYAHVGDIETAASNENDPICGRCFEDRCLTRCWNGTATKFEKQVALNNFHPESLPKGEQS